MPSKSSNKIPPNLAIVSLKRGGNRFELACDKDKLHEWRMGNEIDPHKILYTDLIFHDYLKGQQASDQSLLDVFETEDRSKIYSFILKNAPQSDIKINDKQQTIAKETKLIKDIASDVSQWTINTKTRKELKEKEIEDALIKYNFDIEKFKTDKEPTNPGHLKAGHHKRNERTRQAINFLKNHLPDFDFKKSRYVVSLHQNGPEIMLQKIQRYLVETISVRRSGGLLVTAVINDMDASELTSVLFDYKRSSHNSLQRA